MADEKDLISPGGLVSVASVSSLKVHNRREQIKNADKNSFSIVRKGFFSRIYRCGHKGARTFTVDVCGVEKRKIKQEGICPECFIEWLKSRAPLCVACSLPIFPNDIIALCSLRSRNLNTSRAVFINNSVAGCGRIGCCPTGALYAGCLTEKGFMPIFSNGQTMVDAVMESGQPVYLTIDREDKTKDDKSLSGGRNQRLLS